MSVQSIESQLRKAEDLHRLNEDNYRIAIGHATDLRNQLHQLQQQESARLQKVNQPYEKERDDLEKARSAFRKAEEKYKRAHEEFEKARQLFEKQEAEQRKMATKHERDVQGVEKVISFQEKKLEREIDRKEQEARSFHIKSENARRDIDLLSKRLEDARRHEMEELRRSAANKNEAVDESPYGRSRRGRPASRLDRAA